MSAENAAKLPFLAAERALQEALSTIPFWPEDTKQGQGIAPRAATDRHRESRRQHGAHHKFSVRLKKRASQKLRQWFRRGLLHQPGSPELRQRSGPRCLPLRLESA